MKTYLRPLLFIFFLLAFFLFIFSCSGKRRLRQESTAALQTGHSRQWRADRHRHRIDTFIAVNSEQIEVAHSFSETRWMPRFRTGFILTFVLILVAVLWFFVRFFRR